MWIPNASRLLLLGILVCLHCFFCFCFYLQHTYCFLALKKSDLTSDFKYCSTNNILSLIWNSPVQISQLLFSIPQWLFKPVLLLKILQARLQQYMNHELPDVQTGFRKGRRTRDQITNIKTSISGLLTMPSLWLCGSTNCGKFWKRREYQTTWLASWEICMQVKKQQLELDLEQQTGSKYCHLAY